MPYADLLITNARIITMDGEKPFAEAIAVNGNKIVAVGSHDQLTEFSGPKTRLHDNSGNTVIPGIIESHVHLFIGAVELDLPSIQACPTVEAMRDVITKFRAANTQANIVMAIGATHQQFGSNLPITRQMLDGIVGDIPFIVGCFDHHTVWANTKALETAGLMRGQKLPTGNEIVLDHNGYATGELREPGAFNPVLALMPTGGRESLGFTTGRDPVPAATNAQRKTDEEYMSRGIAFANSLGITSMHNMDGNRYQLELLHALEKRGELNARLEVPFHHKNSFKLADVDEAGDFRDSYKTDMLHSGRVKIFMDGVMETLTALMLDDYPGHPGNKGAPLFTAKEFNELATRVDKHELQMSVHAIGDGAVRRTLDGYEHARKHNGTRDSRHRIEHIELINPTDIPRLKSLGVVSSMQPCAGVGVPGLPAEPILSRVAEKLPYAYAWQTIRNTGASVGFSSDWPVAPLDPFLGIQAAMTVVPMGANCPDQKQSLMDSIHGFTRAGAHMEFMEDRKGILKVGHYADIAVLNRDMEKTPADEMGMVKPVLTICDGRVVYEA